MCRLLGWASSTPLSMAGALGRQDLDAFTELSCLHGDGWGLAHAGEGDDVTVRKDPGAARTSPLFAELSEDLSSDLALVHLRWATLGLPVTLDNAHPFTDGRLAFAHNGSISPPAALERLIDEPRRRQLTGDTDSERFFLAILSRLDGRTDDDAVGRAYADTVRTVRRELRGNSLNSLLLTPTRLFAVCSYDPGEQILVQDPHYYRIGHRTTEGSVVVASSGWGSGWSELDNGQLLGIDRHTRATSVTSLHDG